MDNEPAVEAGAGRPTLDPDLVAERVGDAMVLVHLRTNRIYELNATATRIFELLREGQGRQQIEARLIAEFEVDAATASRELGRVLSELAERELLR